MKGFPPSFKITYSQQFVINRRILKSRGRVCACCGGEPIHSVAHHILPRQIEKDDRLEALILVCRRCHNKVDHFALFPTALDMWVQENPSQVGEALTRWGEGNAALKPVGNPGERPETDHSLNAETLRMARLASERIERLLNGGRVASAA